MMQEGVHSRPPMSARAPVHPSADSAVEDTGARDGPVSYVHLPSLSPASTVGKRDRVPNEKAVNNS